MKLYHYTCHHRHLELQASPLLRGGPGRLAWATDLDWPHREALGIASPCPLGEDRAEYRYRVTGQHHFVRWVHVRHHVPEEFVERIESEPEILIAHWWVSGLPESVVLDPYPVTIR